MLVSLAYAAGFIDGDGSVFVNRYRYRSGVLAHAVVVAAAGVYREPLDAFTALFGGHVRSGNDKRNSSYKPLFIWTRTIPTSGEFLCALAPFLLLKQKQAMLCLELCARKELTMGGRRSPSEDEQRTREVIAKRVAELNSRSCNCPHIGEPSIEYLAGFFDAEGCVGVYRHTGKCMRIAVNVTNRCRWICGQYAQRFDGGVSRGKGGWQWQATRRVAETFLLAVEPFLVVKRERAQNALSVYLGNPIAAAKALSDKLNRKGVA